MKKWILILLAVSMVLLLTACGNRTTEDSAATEAPAATEEAAGKTLRELAEEAIKDAGDLAPFDADDLAEMAGIRPEDYTDFVFLQGDVMEGREVLALRAKDDAAAEKLAEKMEKYLERRRNENRNYAPKAYQALSDARVERKGLTLVMISGGEAGTETAVLLAGE